MSMLVNCRKLLPTAPALRNRADSSNVVLLPRPRSTFNNYPAHPLFIPPALLSPRREQLADSSKPFSLFALFSFNNFHNNVPPVLLIYTLGVLPLWLPSRLGHLRAPKAAKPFTHIGLPRSPSGRRVWKKRHSRRS